jgi:hypothetical protein
MSSVKLALKEQSALEKAELATRVGIALVSNEGTFPEPPVAGADLMDLATALQAAMTEVGTARTALRENLAAQRAAESAVDAALATDARYVQSISGGAESVIALAGMAVAKAKSRVGLMAAPEKLKASAGLFPGEAVLRWRGVRGASSYVAEIRRGTEPGAWRLAGVAGRTKISVEDLTKGELYLFRVAAIGAAGQGPWSEEAEMIVG